MRAFAGLEEGDLGSCGEASLRRSEQLGTIAFQPQRIMRLLADQRLGGVGTAVQRIRRHRAALQIQALQKIQRGCDLVALGRAGSGNRQPRLGVPHAHHQRRHKDPTLSVAAPQRFAVDRHHAARRRPERLSQRCHESGKAARKLIGIKKSKHPAERVVARATMLQRHDLSQLVFPTLNKIGNVNTALGPTQGRKQSQEQKLRQIMTRVDVTRIPNFTQNRKQKRHWVSSSKRRPLKNQPFHSTQDLLLLICDSPAP
ncbi:hypothetical protein [Mesorhizobium sp. LNHC252B00]|uniref:hypothetical protein n=1 Tax=Mesorhizobium sp. LNHC252B00 TaxID=1287252 RepID=UPI0005182276|nr:hypothetical protein [Mesorhizobium sp. LNHC252B00]